MQRRHPHVFGGGARPDWEAAKREEHPQRTSILDGIPRAASAVAWADVATRRAARVGFDWPDLAGVRAKLDEELTELPTPGDEAEAVVVSSAARLIIAIPPVITEPLGLATTSGADLVMICVELGRTRLEDARRTLQLIGRERVAGCLLLH